VAPATNAPTCEGSDQLSSLASCHRFLLGGCILDDKANFRATADVGPFCAPLMWLARAEMGFEIMGKERELGRALSIAERDTFLQWVGDESLGHNTPFHGVWNLRDLSTRLRDRLGGKLSFTQGGKLLYGRDTLDLCTLRSVHTCLSGYRRMHAPLLPPIDDDKVGFHT
jgi:hypothetical protein